MPGPRLSRAATIRFIPGVNALTSSAEDQAIQLRNAKIDERSIYSGDVFIPTNR
jgi:hypothetical protein